MLRLDTAAGSTPGAEPYVLNPKTYAWSARLFDGVRKTLRVNIRMHSEQGQLEHGDIFLFNHFARFETFIPQYLIYRETGAYCRSVAAKQFFTANERLGAYLVDLGAVPNDLPGLLPFLAAEILRGRKIVVFPEGGMVKDRRVIDEHGGYGVYSRHARERRKHHAGAAVLAIGLETFKQGIRRARALGQDTLIEDWARLLAIPSAAELVSAANRPTTIVPANITFYPLRIDENLLHRTIGRMRKDLSPRAAEELLVEGNILLKDTDMDIRLGTALRPCERWAWWERYFIRGLRIDPGNLQAYFTPESAGSGLRQRIYGKLMHRAVGQLRDDYMRVMYASVTVNLSHLASTIILRLVERQRRDIALAELHIMTYLAVKLLQHERSVHLHRSLKNPDAYLGLLDADCRGLDQLMRSAVAAGLVELRDERLIIRDKLLDESGFDEIRLENPIAVYANEAAPLLGVKRSTDEAMTGSPRLTARDLARLRFDDEQRAYAWDRAYFDKPRFAAINAQETATESGEPYFFSPSAARALGVVLVHGFLASPAETRGFAEELAARGYPVAGVRLKGHGTSPWDLRERSWPDWLDSVRRGCAIVEPFAERICLIGFSTGAALCLLLAAERPGRLAGVSAVATPLRFMNRRMRFVPLLYGANRLVRSVTPSDGLMPFRLSDTEHPHINYRHMPIRALYELRRLVESLEQSLSAVSAPVLILQATEDSVVDPGSADLLYQALGSRDKSLVMIPSNRHGILHEDIGATRRKIFEFLERLER